MYINKQTFLSGYTEHVTCCFITIFVSIKWQGGVSR